MSQHDFNRFKGNALFRVKTPKKLSKLLRLTEDQLETVSNLPAPYKRRWKEKKGDTWLNEEPAPEVACNYRPIDIPDRELKALQSRIAFLLSKIPLPDWLFSPVKGRSYVDNAARHLGAKAFWLLDIADYFPSCTETAVAGFFINELECSPDVTAILVRIVTKDGSLPQGSPCSPSLAFFSKYVMWCDIADVVESASLRHSVYADDITLSGDVIYKRDVWQIKRIVHKHGLMLSEAKEVSLLDAPAGVTGTIIEGDKIKLPNRQLKKLFELRRDRRSASGINSEQLDRKIAGREAQKRQVEKGNK